MTMKLIPIDCDTDQDKLAQAISKQLCFNGVEDIMALPLAIKIMSACQKVIDGNLEEALKRLEHK